MHPRRVPASRCAWIMVSIRALEISSGFSHKTCLPGAGARLRIQCARKARDHQYIHSLRKQILQQETLRPVFDATRRTRRFPQTATDGHGLATARA